MINAGSDLQLCGLGYCNICLPPLVLWPLVVDTDNHLQRGLSGDANTGCCLLLHPRNLHSQI